MGWIFVCLFIYLFGGWIFKSPHGAWLEKGGAELGARLEEENRKQERPGQGKGELRWQMVCFWVAVDCLGLMKSVVCSFGGLRREELAERGSQVPECLRSSMRT